MGDEGESVDMGQQKMAFDRSDTKTDAAPILCLDQVEVIYPNGTVALQPTTVDFEDGELTVLLGPSGAGKSTLLRTLNLLVRPTSGAVLSREIGTLDATQSIRAHRRDTAMIFQQHQLIGRMGAMHNVLLSRLGRHSFWRTLVGFSEEERRLALECLTRVGLFEKALTRCDSLSGGQQQRVGIARALAQEPNCKEDRIPVIVSLHQLDYAKAFADRIIGLAGGQIVFDGPPTQLSETVLTQIYGSTGQDAT